jgi:glycosyltransferase involved in cell wall biosynthesis
MSSISFIVCAQAYKKNIPQTLAGIEVQANSNDEIILVTNQNNLSQFSPFILKQFNKILFASIRGCGEARRLGVEAATNELIAFVDDDTLLLDNWRLEAESFLQIPSVGFYHARGSGRNLTMLEVKLRKPFIYFSNTAGSLFRKSLVQAVGNFDPLMIRSEDTDMTSRISCHGWDGAVGSVTIRDLEMKTLTTNLRRLFSSPLSSAQLYLRAGLIIKIQNVFQLSKILKAMGYKIWSLASYEILFTFFWITKKQHLPIAHKYLRQKRQKRTLICLNNETYLLNDYVRIVFGAEGMRLFHIENMGSFSLLKTDYQLEFNSSFLSIKISDRTQDLKDQLLLANFILSRIQPNPKKN